MRTLIYTTGALAVAAAAIFVWSHTVLISPEASTASTVGLGPRALTSPIAPADMMRSHPGPLPVEQWEPF